ncbi:hypothetical protein XM38_038770 [Halomicronema hongdechloris C2206]|uniref:Outer membrane protein beta-barrel domain-containing protein n=1 Tax=Halomicronema hongdechloris C2206 TaxID=1641165 RepID=A0A1Z3HS14_9CYAN|nr:hypothetical protein [Halomicronema hongdechloris]ASC72917.1 hypothetical protein XM38_038770 [Halomicronema hongdechloris C2206]
MAYTTHVPLALGLAALAAAGIALPARANSAITMDARASAESSSDLVTHFTQVADDFEALDSTTVTPQATSIDMAGAFTETPQEPARVSSAPLSTMDADVETSAAALVRPSQPEQAQANSSDQVADLNQGSVEVAQDIAQITSGAYRGMPPAYLGVGGNIGIGDNDTAVGDFGFAVISKISLGPRFAVRPSFIFSEESTSLLAPVTYNFNVLNIRGFRVQPFLGVGADIDFDDDTNLLVDAGVDIPISRQFTLNATTNFSVTDDFGAGLVLGVAYNVPLFFE